MDKIVVIKFTILNTDIIEEDRIERAVRKYGSVKIDVVKSHSVKSTVHKERIIQGKIREYNVPEYHIIKQSRIERGIRKFLFIRVFRPYILPVCVIDYSIVRISTKWRKERSKFTFCNHQPLIAGSYSRFWVSA